MSPVVDFGLAKYTGYFVPCLGVFSLRIPRFPSVSNTRDAPTRAQVSPEAKNDCVYFGFNSPRSVHTFYMRFVPKPGICMRRVDDPLDLPDAKIITLPRQLGNLTDTLGQLPHEFLE